MVAFMFFSVNFSKIPAQTRKETRLLLLRPASEISSDCAGVVVRSLLTRTPGHNAVGDRLRASTIGKLLLNDCQGSKGV